MPVGTARSLGARIRAAAPAADAAEVAWNPEFLREGFAVQGSLSPDRFVFGVTSESAAELLCQVYAAPLARGIPWLSMDLETAELVKVSANAFLATKPSFINAVAEVCEKTGREAVGGALAGRRIAVLGLAFKQGSDDVRDSPSLHVCGQLAQEGAIVTAHDPVATENAARVRPICASRARCRRPRPADVVLHLTEWADYRAIDPAVVARRNIIDTRCSLNEEPWRSAGWSFRALGRPS